MQECDDALHLLSPTTGRNEEMIISHCLYIKISNF
jgi:hypothetical protein